MRKNIITFALAALLAGAVYNEATAQPRWTNPAHGRSVSEDVGLGYLFSAQDVAGNTIVGAEFYGNSVSIGNVSVENNSVDKSSPTLYIAKLDSQNNPIWAKTATVFGESFLYPYGLQVDGAGNSYVCGYLAGSGGADFGNGNILRPSGSSQSVAFLVKYDVNGNVAWSKSWQHISERGEPSNNAIFIKGNDAYVAVGFNNRITVDQFEVTAPSRENNSSDMALVKLNTTNGAVLWTKYLGNLGYTNNQGDLYPYISAIKVDSKENIYVTGHLYAQNILFAGLTLSRQDYSDVLYDTFIAKLNSEGVGIWGKVLPTGLFPDNVSIQNFGIDAQDNIYVIHQFAASTLNIEGQVVQNKGDIDVLIAKWNEEGELQWMTSGGSDSYDESIEIIQDNSGNLYTAGTAFETSEPVFEVGNTKLDLPSSRSGWILKISTEGVPQWLLAPEGTAKNMINGLTYKDDKLYVTGRFFEGTLQIGNQNLVNTGSQRDLFVATLENIGVSVAEQTKGEQQVRFAPTLTNGAVRIEHPLLVGEAHCEVYSILGNKVAEFRLSGGEHSSINIQHLPGGVYSVRVVSGSNVVGSATVQLQK